jgi:hypothetical protein
MLSGRVTRAQNIGKERSDEGTVNYKATPVLCEATVLMSVACRRSHSATSRFAEARAASIKVVSS